MSKPDVSMGYDCMDAGDRAMQEQLPSDSITQQVQEQSPKYSGSGEMSGYATPTQPTMLTEIWAEVKFSDVIFSVYSARSKYRFPVTLKYCKNTQTN